MVFLHSFADPTNRRKTEEIYKRENKKYQGKESIELETISQEIKEDTDVDVHGIEDEQENYKDFSSRILRDEEVIPLVKKILGISEEDGDLICLYRWGSRLFGTKDSNTYDYDFVAIVRGFKFGPLKGKASRSI